MYNKTCTKTEYFGKLRLWWVCWCYHQNMTSHWSADTGSTGVYDLQVLDPRLAKLVDGSESCAKCFNCSGKTWLTLALKHMTISICALYANCMRPVTMLSLNSAVFLRASRLDRLVCVDACIFQTLVVGLWRFIYQLYNGAGRSNWGYPISLDHLKQSSCKFLKMEKDLLVSWLAQIPDC